MQFNKRKPLTDAVWDVPELGLLPRRLRPNLRGFAREVALEQNEMLWRPSENDPLRHHFAIVLHGHMDIVREGRLVDIVSRHEVLGLSALLGRPHTADARATTSGGNRHTTVLLVDAMAFEQGARRVVDREIERAFFRMAVRGSLAVIRRLNSFALLNPYERFIEMLSVVADERKDIWHSQRQLAELLGIDVAQVSRYVTYLLDRRALSRPRTGRGLRIDSDRLKGTPKPGTKDLRPDLGKRSKRR